MIRYKILGLMSGSSLDGVDLALCELEVSDEGQWSWDIRAAETMAYSSSWRRILESLPEADGRTLARVDANFGSYLGERACDFLAKHGLDADYIASHGHTIFHEPEEGHTLQIGHGAYLAVESGLPVICDFRSGDMALFGQGAPLAPLADKLLFPGYEAYLNLGGIANVGILQGDHWLGCDVTGCNQLLNALALESGHTFDAGGQLAASGSFLPALMEAWNRLDFLALPPPKSLSNSWVKEHLVQPALLCDAPVADRLYTACHHIGRQISHMLPKRNGEERAKLLVTGGGAHNDFLMQVIRQHARTWEIEIPDPIVIDYKESLLMAVLGALRLASTVNTLPTVTGARHGISGGAIYMPASG